MNKILRGNLTQKLVELILLSAAAAVALFFALNWIVDKEFDSYAALPAFIDREYDRAADSLQRYVSENGITLSGTRALGDWVKEEKTVQVNVFHDKQLIYSSDGEAFATEEDEQEANSGIGRYYSISFADGQASVYFYGSFEYKFFIYIELVLLGISILAFFILLLFGIRDRIRYIRILENDIEMMEGGELDRPVTVRGDDELGSLAKKLEFMRLSLVRQGETERKAMQANRSLVTEMSHDLRTPLTSMLLYTQILQNSKYKSEEEMREYLSKIYSRTMQIKSLSDSLFYHFLVDGGTEPGTPCEEDLKAVFPDVLSDFVCTLEAKGFTVETTGDWPEAKSKVNIEYLTRIMDNLLSNILKYADSSVPVRLLFFYKDEQFSVELYNKIVKRRRYSESSHIGIANVTSMMERMGGSYTYAEADGVFCSKLQFPCE